MKIKHYSNEERTGDIIKQLDEKKQVLEANHKRIRDALASSVFFALKENRAE